MEKDTSGWDNFNQSLEQIHSLSNLKSDLQFNFDLLKNPNQNKRDLAVEKLISEIELIGIDDIPAKLKDLAGIVRDEI